MSTEIELKLELTPKAASKLARHPLLAELASQKLQLLNTYYDTPSLELHARRIAFRFRKKGWQWLSTIKTAEAASGGLALRSEWESEATPGLFEFEHVDHPELRAFLEERRDTLVPVFTTDFRRQLWQVPFGESMIELAVDRGTIESCGRHARICEIELELISGRVEDIFALTRRLQDDIDLRPAIASKAERGYSLFLNEPLKPFKAKTAQISASMTPVEAFRVIALGCLEHFQRNEAGILAGGDPEFIHQARVALRRLRSAIKLFAPVLPKEFVHSYSRTWQTLASALGDARNWDVLASETIPPIAAAFPKSRVVRALSSQAYARCRRARRAITLLLASREYPRLLLEFTSATYLLPTTNNASLRKFAARQLEKAWLTAAKSARRHADLGNAERHRMRIAFKKLRYTLDFFSPLIPPREMPRQSKILAALQNELGYINDHVTAQSLLVNLAGRLDISLVSGWIAGRHELLLKTLPIYLDKWLKTKCPFAD